MSRNNDNISNRVKNRGIWICIIGIIIYIFLFSQLIKIQVLKANEYQSKLEKQNVKHIDLNTGRGTIYDRNGKPLTDEETKNVMIIEKDKFINDHEVEKLVLKYSKGDEKDVVKELQTNYSLLEIEMELKYISTEIKEELLQKGIIVEEKTLRYSANGILSHTIGFIGSSEDINKDDKVGKSGIEKYMNDMLTNSNEEYVSAFKAGQSGNNSNVGILKGSINVVNENEDAKHLKLTIDKDIQETIEGIVDKEEKPTAVVISDVETGEILAMSSRPNFELNNMSKYNDEGNSNGELRNRVVQNTYPPGSIFKIVVLYAGLENGFIDEGYTYNCTGKVEISKDGKVLTCPKKEGHGIQNLQQTFSNSCNTAFFDIASKMNEEIILEYAKNLKLDDKVEIGLYEEINRKLPNQNEIALNNLCIGQGTLELTPIQINQMTQIIANNGVYKPLYLYDSIIDKDKNVLKIFSQDKEQEIISPYTMTIIKDMMKKVSKEGTGKDLKYLEGGAGVKTGTAQSKSKGENITHSWITGFYPEDNPKYTITVLVEGITEDDKHKSSIPIFNEICTDLKK